MAKTEPARAMDDVESALRPFLKGHGFRTRSRTCNRTTSDGLIHVINFQMGRFDPPGTSYVPLFRKNLYGRFTVNIGVYVPEIALAQYYWQKPRSFAHEVECCLRMRLAELGGESDKWWALPADQQIVIDLRRRLEQHVFPYFARLEDRNSVLQELEVRTGSVVPRIARAVVMAARGETEAAKELFRQQITSASKPEPEYLREMAMRLGLGPI